VQRRSAARKRTTTTTNGEIDSNLRKNLITNANNLQQHHHHQQQQQWTNDTSLTRSEMRSSTPLIGSVNRAQQTPTAQRSGDIQPRLYFTEVRLYSDFARSIRRGCVLQQIEMSVINPQQI